MNLVKTSAESNPYVQLSKWDKNDGESWYIHT